MTSNLRPYPGWEGGNLPVSQMEEELDPAEGSDHLETFLERGIMRNTRKFSAVFDRIFDKVWIIWAKKLTVNITVIQGAYIVHVCILKAWFTFPPFQYEREFPEDEIGGRVINFYGEDSEKQIERIFGGENAGKLS